MGSRLPLFNTGQLVRVFTYYDDMIVHGTFTAVITGINAFQVSQADNTHYVYDIFSYENPMLRTAEEFAVEPLTEE
jgi:hypothetical protein